jgi:hypothetical protein
LFDPIVVGIEQAGQESRPGSAAPHVINERPKLKVKEPSVAGDTAEGFGLG